MIRKAAKEDIVSVTKIYEAILDNEEAGGSVGWMRGVYPTEQTALAALEKGTLYVYEEEGRIVAAAKIDQDQVPEYADCQWEHEAPDSQVMVLHTLVVDPACSRRGYGKEFVRFYEAYASEKNSPYLRMDTNAKNRAARRMYTKLGYKEVGIVPCEFNGIPDVQLVCLEKKLERSMKQVIIFAGTTEGRAFGEWLAENGVETLVCVATEYGRQLVEPGEHLTVHQGRMEPEEMEVLLEKEGRPLVLDVTHPYAVEVSKNIRAACEKAGCEYLRLIRPSLVREADGDCVMVDSVEEAVEWLEGTKGRILVTTGSKELQKFTALSDYQERVYARVLATPEVVKSCTELGFTGQHLICMQGPFSLDLNTAMLRQLEADYLVTKESGKAGGFEEKLEAARLAGAKVVLIGRPPEQQGISPEEGKELLRNRFSLPEGKRFVTLAGIGMGSWENMTGEAQKAFQEADCILGAGRMLESLRGLGKPLFDVYDPKRMVEYVKSHPGFEKLAVALSGDTGFYSGAKRLTDTFEREGFEVRVLPGISSVSYFCSRLRISWEDVKLISVHGRRENLVAAVQAHFRTFTLLGGRDGVDALCRELLDYGLEEVKIYLGERLHYPDERIILGTPEELLSGSFDGLCVALIENPQFYGGVRSCIPDEDFLRGEAPMTKSEIRSLSVSKLRLQRDSVIYDIGAGTGSVSVELALQAPEGCVWAVEKKPEAADLIRENMRKFKTPNIEVIEGLAPEAMEELPRPTHAFIGGSSGKLKEILELLLEKNPKIRVVVNAVSLETVAEADKCLKELPFGETEIVQVQVSKARKLGAYQLMMGQNPVYIFTAQGKEPMDGRTTG